LFFSLNSAHVIISNKYKDKKKKKKKKKKWIRLFKEIKKLFVFFFKLSTRYNIKQIQRQKKNKYKYK